MQIADIVTIWKHWYSIHIVPLTLLAPSGSRFYSCCTVEIAASAGACKRV